MKYFDAAFEHALDVEGGFTDDPDDKGNWTGGKVGEGQLKGTKYGISAATYPKLDIKNLTEEEAKDIYYKDWWVAYSYDKITMKSVAIKLFDMAINMPVKNAHKILQRAVRACGMPIKDDGVIGPRTLRSMAFCAEEILIVAMRCEQAGYYRIIANLYPYKYNKYLKGWLNRAYQNNIN